MSVVVRVRPCSSRIPRDRLELEDELQPKLNDPLEGRLA